MTQASKFAMSSDGGGGGGGQIGVGFDALFAAGQILAERGRHDVAAQPVPHDHSQAEPEPKAPGSSSQAAAAALASSNSAVVPGTASVPGPATSHADNRTLVPVKGQRAPPPEPKGSVNGEAAKQIQGVEKDDGGDCQPERWAMRVRTRADTPNPVCICCFLHAPHRLMRVVINGGFAATSCI